MFFGAFFIFLFLLGTGQAPLIANLNFTQIIWITVTAIILLGYVMTWYSGLKHIPVSQATVILLLGSPITILFSSISSKMVSLQEVLAGLLIILGIIFVFGLKQILQLIKEIRELIYVRAYPPKF